jgi:hypothetical protein
MYLLWPLATRNIAAIKRMHGRERVGSRIACPVLNRFPTHHVGVHLLQIIARKIGGSS